MRATARRSSDTGFRTSAARTGLIRRPPDETRAAARLALRQRPSPRYGSSQGGLPSRASQVAKTGGSDRRAGSCRWTKAPGRMPPSAVAASRWLPGIRGGCWRRRARRRRGWRTPARWCVPPAGAGRPGRWWRRRAFRGCAGPGRLGVAVGADRPPDGDTGGRAGAGRMGRLGRRAPIGGRGLLRSDAGAQAEGDVGPDPGALAGLEDGGLVEGEGLVGSAGLALGGVGRQHPAGASRARARICSISLDVSTPRQITTSEISQPVAAASAATSVASS
jgi:hypothetical protein